MPLYLDLCSEELVAPHVVYRTRLALHILNQLGRFILKFLVSFIHLSILDAMNVHVMSPVEVFIEPQGLCGRMRMMLIICPVISRFQIPYFNSELYVQTIG